MKYVVPVSGAEHLFHANESGLDKAKELALAINSIVVLEDGNHREVVFPLNKVLKISAKSLDNRPSV